MAYLSDSFDFEHMQNSTNWEAVQKKRSFVARKMHKINKVSVLAIVLFFFVSDVITHNDNNIFRHFACRDSVTPA